MQPKTADFVNVTGGKLYYEVAGEGEPLVLVHAGFVDSGMWDSQWQAFARQYRVIRYDMRGYGKSSPVEKPVPPLQDLEALLKHLDVRQAHVLGCSMGGAVVINFALAHPDMMRSMTVVSAVPDGFEMQGEPPKELMQMMEAAQKGDTQKVSELQIQLWVDGPYRKPDQVDAAVRQQAAAMNRIPVEQNTFGKMNAVPPQPVANPASKRLNEIHLPTLVMAGALDNSEIVRAADVMTGAIKGAQQHIIADAAHVPNMEKPAEFNRVVLDFLKNVK